MTHEEEQTLTIYLGYAGVLTEDYGFEAQCLTLFANTNSFFIDTNDYSRYPFRRMRRSEKPAFQ